MGNVVEETLNIRLDHITDRSRHDRRIDRFERLMATPFRSKTVRTVAEVSLVDRPQDAGDSLLDDLVLDRRQAQWTLARLALGDIHPFGRQRMVPLGLEASHQVDELRIQVLAIVMPTHSVNATSLLLAE